MASITFDDVEEKYQKALHYLEVNERLCFEKHPEHAVWIDNKVLAGWFYESSKEWLKDYKDFAMKYFSKIGETTIKKIEMIHRCGANLIDKVESFRTKINSKFGVGI